MTQTSTQIKAIKAAVRQRDGMRCTECGITVEEHVARIGIDLDVHRVVPGSPYSLDGCVTLCRRCHGPKPRRSRGALSNVRRLSKSGKLLAQLHVTINVLLMDAVDAAVERTRPRSSVRYVVEVALEEWLKSQGLWPPAPAD